MEFMTAISGVAWLGDHLRVAGAARYPATGGADNLQSTAGILDLPILVLAFVTGVGMLLNSKGSPALWLLLQPWWS